MSTRRWAVFAAGGIALVLLLWWQGAWRARDDASDGAAPDAERTPLNEPGLKLTDQRTAPEGEGRASEAEAEAASEGRVAKPYAVYGHVRKASDGTPVPGVPIFIFPFPWGIQSFELTARTVSGADGSFRVEGLKAEDANQSFVAMGKSWISLEVADETSGAIAQRASDKSQPTAEATAGVPFHLDLSVVEAARIEGWVLLPDGSPAEGATVRGLRRTVGPGVSKVRFFTSEDLIEPVRTDAEGHFVIPAVSANDAFVLEARSPDHAWVRSSSVATSLGQTAQMEIHLLEPRRVSLTVLSEADGKSIEGAVVRTSRRRNNKGFIDPTDLTLKTDAEGHVLLTPLPKEALRFTVEARMHERYRSSWGGNAYSEILQPVPGSPHSFKGTVHLEAASEVTGRVLLPEGVYLGWVYVELHAVEAPGHEGISRYAEIDESDGSFTMPVPLSGTYELTVETDAGGKAYGGRVEVRPGQQGVEIRVELEPGVSAGSSPLIGTIDEETIEGPVNWWDIVVAGPEGEALEELSVRVLPPWRQRGLYGSQVNPRVHQSGGKGHYRIPIRPDTPGIYLKVSFVTLKGGERGAPRLIGPLAGGGGTQTIHLSKALTISGRVLGVDGRPLQGQRVEAVQEMEGATPKGKYCCTSFSQDALTDADGRFTVRALAAGAHMLWLSPERGLVPEAPRRVAAGSTDVILRTKTPTSSLITVLDDGGRPVVGAVVSAYIEDGLRPLGDSTRNVVGLADESGQCRLSGLDDTATYRLDAARPRERKDLESASREAWRPADTTLTLKRLMTVRGRVESPDGEPIEGAFVTLVHQDGGEDGAQASDEDGDFTFSKVTRGAVRLRAAWRRVESDGPQNGPASEAVVVDAGASGVVLILPEGRVLTIQVQNMEPSRAGREGALLRPVGRSNAPLIRVPLDDRGRGVCRGLDQTVAYNAWVGPTRKGLIAYGVAEAKDNVIRLSLRESGEVKVHVTWPADAYRKSVYLTGPGVFLEGEEGAEGIYTIPGVPLEGRWPVTASCRLEGQKLKVTGEAAAGESLELRVKAP